jgi:hypothetical protein
MHNHDAPTLEIIKAAKDTINEELYERLEGIGTAVMDKLKSKHSSLVENFDDRVIEKYLNNVLNGYYDPFEALYDETELELAIEEADPYLNERTCDNCTGAYATIRWSDGEVQKVFFSFIEVRDDGDDEAIFYYMEDRNDLYVGFSNGEWTIVE